MLHEIILSLSGHPSTLFDASQDAPHGSASPSQLLSPPEAELLSSIGTLSRLHRKIRDHANKIATSHSSTVCRSVASTILSVHLSEFQRKILDVESQILGRDASTVGAYNIVPLAAIVGEFSSWSPILQWLWTISQFMLASNAQYQDDPTKSSAAFGASIIDKLRAEAQTGYTDIQIVARSLGDAAETAWMRQLSTWVLYGRLSSSDAHDFFIQQESAENSPPLFAIKNKLLPKFVTSQTASSVLFIGRSLNQIHSLPSLTKGTGDFSRLSEMDLLPRHVEFLSSVGSPITSAKLSGAVDDIRVSLSRNLLQYLLPQEKIVEILTVFHQFFLLGRGEFAVSLVAEMDKMLSSRSQAAAPPRTNDSLKNIVLKEIEVNQVLMRTLSALSSLSEMDEHTDDILDLATRILALRVSGSSTQRPGTPGRAQDKILSLVHPSNPTSFHSLLASTPTVLTMEILSPLDLFISESDLSVYSSINTYLLAGRRAYLHLAQLWRHSSLRRDHPCPPGYKYSNSEYGKSLLRKRRLRSARRMQEMRKVWATCAAALFFLGESEAYFQGSVVQEAFEHFLSWATRTADCVTTNTISDASLEHGALASHPTLHKEVTRQQHDAEALGFAHRRFLSFLMHALLLTDSAFVNALHAFFHHIDELVAYIARLTSVQQSLDLEEDEGLQDFTQNYQKEEKEVYWEVDRARRRLDSDLKTLVERLREIDSERIDSFSLEFGDSTVGDSLPYKPLKVGGIDRLLMKLDWYNDTQEEPQEDIALLGTKFQGT